MMKKLIKSKCGLFVLSFALLSIGLFLGFSSNVSAENFPYPDPPTFCTENDMPLTMPSHYNSWVDGFDEDSDTIVVAFKSVPDVSGNSRFYFWALENPELISPPQMTFGVTGTTPYLTYNATSNRSNVWTFTFQVNSLNEQTGFIQNAVYENTYGSNQLMRNPNMPLTQGQANAVDCMIRAKNVNYSEQWDEATDDFRFDESDGPELEKPPENCSPFDFGCWLSGLVDMVGEAFADLFGALGRLLTWIFVPDPDNLQFQLESFVDTLEDRLGILWIPFDLLIAFLQVFIAGNPENWVQPNHYYCGGDTTATLFGHTVRIYDLIPYCKVILNSGPPTGYSISPVYPLVELVLNFFRMSVFLAVCSLMYHKVKELLHK